MRHMQTNTSLLQRALLRFPSTRRALELPLVEVGAWRVFQAGVLRGDALLGEPGWGLGPEQSACLGVYQVPGVLSSVSGGAGVRMEPQPGTFWYLEALPSAVGQDQVYAEAKHEDQSWFFPWAWLCSCWPKIRNLPKIFSYCSMK